MTIHIAGMRGLYSPIAFSGFDLRVYFRIVLVVWAWRYASFDYSALALLSNFPPLWSHEVEIVQAISVWINREILTLPGAIAVIQILGLSACAIAFWAPGRVTFMAVLLFVGLIEFPAFLWRFQTWDNLALVSLLLAVIAPCSLRRAFSGGREVTRDASIVGWIVAAYMATIYFFAGLSKPIYSITWPLDVNIGDLWRAQFIDAAPYGDISSVWGEALSWLAITFPLATALIMTVVMLDQILLPLALINQHFRLIGAPIIFLSHVGIWLATGIFFWSMPLVGPAIFLPWRGLRKGVQDGRIPWVWMIGFFLAAMPVVTRTYYFPFPKSDTFGWVYPAIADAGKGRYVLGYQADSGEYLPLPRGIWGFLERASLELNKYATNTMSGSHQVRAGYPQLAPLVCSQRPLNSNRWLLGTFALPGQRWSVFEEMKPNDGRLYILRSRPNAEDLADKYRSVRVTWEPVREVERPQCP